MFDSNRLRSVRESKGLESKQVAENIGVTAAAYSKYETGKAVSSIGVLEKIAKFLNVSTDYLMGITDDNSTSWAEAH